MDISKKIFAYIKITRPLNVFITFLVVIVAILISQKDELAINFIVLAAIAAALTAAGGNIINDIYDIETDKYSHPNRVLVKKYISKKEALALYLLIVFISILIAAYVSVILIIFVLAVTILLYIYSFRLKQLPLVGNITISLITGLAFIYGGLVAGNATGAFVPAVFAFFINLVRELVKDIQDIDGDLKLNYKTFPIKYGIEHSKKLIVSLSVLLIIITFYPFITQLYRIEYFLIIMIFVNPILVLTLKMLFNKKNELQVNNVSSLLKLNMVMGLIAIWFGK